MDKKRAKRLRKITSKAKKYCGYKNIKKEIKKTQKEKKGLTNHEITKMLKCSSRFIGCFSEDEVNSIKFQTFPVFLIVNIDQSNMPGSHWIALGIFNEKIEIFDSLGPDLFNWSRIPCQLLKLLHRLSITRKIIVSQRIQSDSSTFCGFYAVFYTLFRPFYSFNFLKKLFTKNLSANDKILLKIFS